MRDRVTARVLIGGVGYRFQRDASFGLHVTDALAEATLPAGVEVEDLGYGALLAAQDLAAASPRWDRVILVAGTVRGRRSGLYEWRHDPVLPDGAEIQERIREAGAGVVHLDHLLVIGRWLDAFPADLRVLELEPADAGAGEGLSPTAQRLARVAIERVRTAASEPAATTIV